MRLIKNKDEVLLLEINIQDMSGEFISNLMRKLFENNAIDVWFTPIFSWDNKPMYKLSLLCIESQKDFFIDVLFRESNCSTIYGQLLSRWVMDRTTVNIILYDEKIRVKRLVWGDIVKYTPEWEDCCYVADKKNIPVAELYNTVQSMAQKQKC